MCCPLLLIAFFGPRVTLFVLWLSGYFYGVFTLPLWGFLGFLFMPYTTLAYGVAMRNGGVSGLWLVILIVAVIADLGVHGGSTRMQRRRRINEQS